MITIKPTRAQVKTLEAYRASVGMPAALIAQPCTAKGEKHGTMQVQIVTENDSAAVSWMLQCIVLRMDQRAEATS